METHSEHQLQRGTPSASTDSICRRLCQMSSVAIPDFAAISAVARQSDVVAERMLDRANSSKRRLVHPITKLAHAVVFLGAAGVQEAAESLVLRLDEPHEATPAPLGSRRQSADEDSAESQHNV